MVENNARIRSVVRRCSWQLLLNLCADLDVPLKTTRLKQWYEDTNRVQSVVTYDFVFVDEESFTSYSPRSFANSVANFRQYKDE